MGLPVSIHLWLLPHLKSRMSPKDRTHRDPVPLRSTVQESPQAPEGCCETRKNECPMEDRRCDRLEIAGNCSQSLQMVSRNSREKNEAQPCIHFSEKKGS